MLNPDFKDILSILSAHDVKFMLVGAYAMAFHGYPRTTGDIDIFIAPTIDNAKKVYRALTEFGAPLEQITPEEFAKPGTVYQIGVAPRRIDILNRISGVSFEEGFSDKNTVTVEGLQIHILSKAKVIANKKATGRPKDLLDIDHLSA
ncbi:MAG: hypothetical protein A2293_06185 [Elusimicrobia bacterium RIFOXYB2_FULL_49_7]|nr:MAG: hypothetical protein A2293_06185 [Elusimicrobia bacterium RIFOXYB2_FULL_49_7]